MEAILGSTVLHGLRDALVAFDFDGTLAPIVPRAEDAAMRPSTRRLLAQVAQLYPCAVISGRTQAELEQLLGGATVWYIVGTRDTNKGEAVARICEKVGCRDILYVGDGEHDEHVFALPRVTGVHVGKGSSKARFYLDEQEDIDMLLQRLIDARR